MAIISFDASAGPAIINPGTSISVGHTCTGANGLLLAWVTGDGTDDVDPPTYGGGTMTLGTKTNGGGEGRYIYLFYLVSPATGSNTCTVTRATSSLLQLDTDSYTGVLGVSPLDVGTINSGSGTLLSGSILTTTNNCWVMSKCRFQQGNTGTMVGGTYRISDTGDSNGLITPAQAHSMTWTGNNGNIVYIMASFKPLPGGGYLGKYYS